MRGRRGEGEGRRLTIPLSDAQTAALKPRMSLPLCPGLEGAGTVVAAGLGVEGLVGRTVAMFGGGMFAEYRKTGVEDCLIPAEGTSPARAAGSFVNPLTAVRIVMSRSGQVLTRLYAPPCSLSHQPDSAIPLA